MRAPYVNVTFVSWPSNGITISKTFPYPDDKTLSKLADEIAEWIRGLDGR